MPVLRVGQTDIPYTIRYSTRALRKRISVTPQGVEVVAPQGTPTEGSGGVLAFVESKRRWIFDAYREIEERTPRIQPQHYASGAKLQYRGRWLMMIVRSEDVESVQITCRNRFQIQVPGELVGPARVNSIREAMEVWLKERALRDLQRYGRRHQETLGLEASDYRLSDSKYRWGSCGTDGVIRAHWGLIKAPAAVMEYVAAHEVAHLTHRNHSPEFWRLLGRTLPDWPERKALLEQWEVEHRIL